MQLLDRFMHNRNELLSIFGSSPTGYFERFVDLTGSPWLRIQNQGVYYFLFKKPPELDVSYIYGCLGAQLCTNNHIWIVYNYLFPEGKKLANQFPQEVSSSICFFKRANRNNCLRTHKDGHYSMFHVIRTAQCVKTNTYMIFDNDIFCHSLQDLFIAINQTRNT